MYQSIVLGECNIGEWKGNGKSLKPLLAFMACLLGDIANSY